MMGSTMFIVSSCVQSFLDFASCEHANTNACDWSPGLFALGSMSRSHDGREKEEEKQTATCYDMHTQY